MGIKKEYLRLPVDYPRTSEDVCITSWRKEVKFGEIIMVYPLIGSMETWDMRRKKKGDER